MTTETIAIRAFFAIVAIAGLGAVCSGLRAYGRDSFRQKSFALRDELFDYAASGAVAFNDPAYWRLRLMMNTVIQYSHRFTFGEAVLPMLVAIVRREPSTPAPIHRAWHRALTKQPKDVRERLQEFDHRFHILMARHLLLYTPLAWPLLVVVALMTGDLKVSIVIERAHEIEEDAIRDMGAEAAFAAQAA